MESLDDRTRMMMYTYCDRNQCKWIKLLGRRTGERESLTSEKCRQKGLEREGCELKIRGGKGTRRARLEKI